MTTARVHLVRHGRAAAGWDDDPDPGLDDAGHAQAGRLADLLAELGPLPLVVSPLRRCRETAAPLAERWGIEPEIEPLVAELPSPEGVPFGARVPWLRRAMTGRWGDLDERYAAYREGVLGRVLACRTDTVIVSHFVAINAVLGACVDDDRLLLHHLDNTSVSVVDVDVDGRLTLVRAGDEDPTTLIR